MRTSYLDVGFGWLELIGRFAARRHSCCTRERPPSATNWWRKWNELTKGNFFWGVGRGGGCECSPPLARPIPVPSASWKGPAKSVTDPRLFSEWAHSCDPSATATGPARDYGGRSMARGGPDSAWHCHCEDKSEIKEGIESHCSQ